MTIYYSLGERCFIIDDSILNDSTCFLHFAIVLASNVVIQRLKDYPGHQLYLICKQYSSLAHFGQDFLGENFSEIQRILSIGRSLDLLSDDVTKQSPTELFNHTFCFLNFEHICAHSWPETTLKEEHLPLMTKITSWIISAHSCQIKMDCNSSLKVKLATQVHPSN